MAVSVDCVSFLKCLLKCFFFNTDNYFQNYNDSMYSSMGQLCFIDPFNYIIINTVFNDGMHICFKASCHR